MNAASGSEGRLSFGFDLQPKAGDATPNYRSGDNPFRILLLADLSGRAQRNIEDAADLGARPCFRVDVDDYDSVLTKYAPRIDWPIGRLNFKEIDDFHPDQLYQKLDVFRYLRDTRAKLKDPGTFAETAQQLRAEKRIGALPAEDTADKDSEADVFSRLLGRPSTPGESSPPGDAVSAMIRQIVAPYIVPEVDPQLDQYIASVDSAIGDQMRAILHHPDFQSLEATWCGIRDMVTSLELDEDLEVAVLDASKQELLDDLRTHMTDLAGSGLYRQWVDKAIGGPDSHPWSLIVGCYDFEYNKEDIGLLAGLGVLASHAHAPFVADAHPSLVGCKSFARFSNPTEWVSDLSLFNELRKSAVSRWIGLALPRVLMRMPYGESSEEIDAFAFEELGEMPDHAHFLWGSAAMACAKLVGTAFKEGGGAFTLENHLDLLDLPAYTVSNEGEKELIPCAEIFMSDRAGDEISRRGLIPLMSYRHRNAVRVRNIQSISDPPTSLF
jgi:type VI secretion system protein ImpC